MPGNPRKRRKPGLSARRPDLHHRFDVVRRVVQGSKEDFDTTDE
jgi:hypothetical protein